jgi:hypothetical protein
MVSMLDLVSIKEAEDLVNMKGATIRSWVRQGLVAGIPGKPFRVHRESLLKYIIHDRGNTALQKLFSRTVSDSGCFSVKGE